MNARERFVKTLTGEPVDRVPFMKIFGGPNATHPEWEREYPGLFPTRWAAGVRARRHTGYSASHPGTA